MSKLRTANPVHDSLLKRIVKRTYRTFFYVGLFSLALNLLLLAMPLYSLQVLDRVMGSHSIPTLIGLTVLAIWAFIFYGIFSAVRSIILTRIAEWLEMRLAPTLLESAVTKSSFGGDTNAGQHHRDLASLKGFITGPGITTLFDAPWSIIFILVIYLINPVLGFLVLGGSIALVACSLLTEYATKKPLERSNKIALRSFRIADTASQNAEAIEAMGMMNNITNNWLKSTEEGRAMHHVANQRAQLILSVSRVLRIMLQIAVTGIGALLALDNDLTVGGMIASSILAGRALGPFEAAIGVWKSMIGAREAYARLDVALGEHRDLRGQMELPPPEGHLAVENLIYRPAGSDKMIIKGISFPLRAGESLGIIGPSAAGKSTLAKLIMGILPPSHGTVRLDGAEIFKWNRAHLGPYVGYLPQHVDLFNGTVRDNIARMDSNASAEAVIRAAKIAGVHEMILRLPQGYDTEFATGNQSLSPGQRQRIGLARAVYGNPRFIVLDEPNSNLDGEGERCLTVCLNTLKTMGITFIVVAHRPSIVSSIDNILVLRDGAIEQFGPREQVLGKYVTPGAANAPAVVRPKVQANQA